VAWGHAAWASSVTELVREARAHQVAHEDDLAARRYMEALALDPTCEEAYLGLGSLRERNGEMREAERVYSVALAHVPQLKAALVGRARARRSLGARDDAEQDLAAYAMAEDDTAVLRELATWYGEDGRTAAQLAVWRRILAVLSRTGDVEQAHEARTVVRALQILMGPVDPVISPPAPSPPARRTMAAAARRGV
jgi:tetratricopeptide (TPR) repeat protein